MLVSEMNDRQLMAAIKASHEQALQMELWKRYENLVHKNWAVLRKQMDNSALILNMKDDYYSESFIAFRKAVDAVNLDKIYDDNWKFLGYFRWYLKNVRSDIISNLTKTYKHEKSYYVESSAGEEVARVEMVPDVVSRENMKFDPVVLSEEKEAANRCERAIAHCMSRWNPKRQQIFKWRQQGVSKSAIATKLGVHPATITYHMQAMQKDVESELRALQ